MGEREREREREREKFTLMEFYGIKLNLIIKYK
jgi:hypothetical protein